MIFGRIIRWNKLTNALIRCVDFGRTAIPNEVAAALTHHLAADSFKLVTFLEGEDQFAQLFCEVAAYMLPGGVLNPFKVLQHGDNFPNRQH